MARYTDQYKAKVDIGLGTAVELTGVNFPTELLRPHRKRQRRTNNLSRLHSGGSSGNNANDSEDGEDKDDADDGVDVADDLDDESDDNDYNMHGDVEAGGDSDNDFDDTANE